MFEQRRRLDSVLALTLTALGIFMTLDPANGNGTVLDTVFIPTVTLPLLWRLREPFVASVAVSAGTLVSGLPTFDQTRCGVAIPAILLTLFALASRQNRARALIGLGLALASLVVLLLTDPQLDAGAVFILPLAAGVWGAGCLVCSRNALAVELAERSRELERTREHNARMAVEVERARLASDLDLRARRHLDEVVKLAVDPGRSTATFTAIEREGRASLNEMRGLLGVLGTDTAGAAPVPSLQRIESLLGEVGDRAVLTIEGERRPLPGAVELAAYRLVEHALEVLGSGTEVTLRYADGVLEVAVGGEVCDPSAVEAVLAAARERVTVQGGTFAAEDRPPGRVLVSARLPVGAVA